MIFLSTYLVEVDGAGTVSVDVSNHLLDFLLLRLETHSTHGHLQLLGIDVAGAVGIKKVEGLTDLLFLLLSEGELVTLLLLPEKSMKPVSRSPGRVTRNCAVEGREWSRAEEFELRAQQQINYNHRANCLAAEYPC
jgi:hypothetical protein